MIQAFILGLLLVVHHGAQALRRAMPANVVAHRLKPRQILPSPRRQTETAVGGALSGTVQGLKDRAAYDPQFITKLSIEMLVGFVTQTIAEVGKRGANTLNEMDFVVADLIMGLSANFAAVYLSAPTGADAGATANAATTAGSFWATCPDNAFQRGHTFSMLQRVGSILKVAPKLFWIGSCVSASCIHRAPTSSLIPASPWQVSPRWQQAQALRPFCPVSGLSAHTALAVWL
jgi:hypothetical protein